MTQKAPLESTLEDHVAVGGSPPDILANNPGKSQGELMTGQEIADYLAESLQAIKDLEDMGLKGQRIYQQQVDNYNKDRQYLATIGKLPEGYGEFRGE